MSRRNWSMEFSKNVQSIVSDGLEIDCFVVPWDSEIFGFPVAQIERVAIKKNGNHREAMRELQSWIAEERIRLACCRLPNTNLPESMLLEEYGFRFVEMVYRPTCFPIRLAYGHDDGLTIEEAGEDDLARVEAIAASAFTTGRFFLDARLEPAASHRRYATWVRNSLADSRQQVLVARAEGAIAAFFIVERRADQSAYWHLTAIAPEFQGRGLGRRVWSKMMARHKEEGLRRIETTVSAHNVPVINLYSRLGFRFSAPQMTFHWLR